jgi:hypothetical protein
MVRRIYSDPQFLEFYSAYPRKVGKQSASKAYAKARISTSHEDIMAALERAKHTDRRFRGDIKWTPHPSMWLLTEFVRDVRPRWSGPTPTPEPGTW